MSTKKKTNEAVEIKPIILVTATVRVVGISPLIVHKWSEKAKKEMLQSMQSNSKENGPKKKKEREDKRPFMEFVDSLYWLTEKPVADTDAELQVKFQEAIENGARFGFPATAFKAAAISGAYRRGWVPDKMGLRGAFFIDADDDGLVEIKGSAPTMREDPVHIGISGSDLRYRGEFASWYADLNITYDENGPYTFGDIVNYLNVGGFVCGVGEWRAERDGQNGGFQVLGAPEEKKK